MAALDLKEGGQQRLGFLRREIEGAQSLDHPARALDVRLDVPDMAGRSATWPEKKAARKEPPKVGLSLEQMGELL